MRKQCLLIALAVIFFNSSAEAGQIQISPTLGTITVGIDSNYTPTGTSKRKKLLSTGISIGYFFDNNFVLEIGHNWAASTLFGGIQDQEGWNENKALAGYSFDVNNYLRVMAKIGFSDWKLHTKEASLFDSNSETNNTTGHNMFGQIYGEILFSERFSVFMTYHQAKTKFGDIQSTDLGLIFKI